MKFRNSSLFDSFPVFLCRIPLVFFPIVNGKKSIGIVIKPDAGNVKEK